MTVRPFLSHKREDASDLEQLRRELSYSGVVGWQDIRDLPLGQRFMALFRDAIGRETTGFIWWGTARSLQSSTICRFEIPRALRRSRRRWRRQPYPVVPLFVDLRPGSDRTQIEEAMGERSASRLLGLQGIERGAGEPMEAFTRKAARRYLRDSLRGRGDRQLRIEITASREPTLGSDLAIDWRGLAQPNGDPRSAQDLARMVLSLTDIRDALQAEARRPHICVEAQVRVPLGAVIGWEWNRVRPVKLDIIQRAPDGSCSLVRDGEFFDVDLPEPRTALLSSDSGPVIVAASIGLGLDGTLTRYASEVGARRMEHLHVPLREGRFLDGPEINAIARWVAERLRQANDEGGAKHLILAGPIALAMRVGALAHGTGSTWIPFWDGESFYSGGLTIGGSSAGPGATGPTSISGP